MSHQVELVGEEVLLRFMVWILQWELINKRQQPHRRLRLSNSWGLEDSVKKPHLQTKTHSKSNKSLTINRSNQELFSFHFSEGRRYQRVVLPKSMEYILMLKIIKSKLRGHSVKVKLNVISYWQKLNLKA